MLQKSFWTVAAAALTVGVLLIPAAQPANAQVRIRLTQPRTGPITNGSGNVLPSGGGIVQPTGTTQQSQTTSPQTTPAPVVTPQPAPTVKPVPSSSPVYQPAPIGFSAGPSILGARRTPIGHKVNRRGLDLNGDGYPEVQKDYRSK
jgi:hypothetical protein